MEKLTQAGDVRAIAAAARADLSDRIAQFLVTHPRAVIGRCPQHHQWLAVGLPTLPVCPYCEADQLAAAHRADAVLRLFVSEA